MPHSFSRDSNVWYCVAGGVAAGFAAGAAVGMALVHVWTPSFCKPKARGVELLYWPGRGLMEVPRMMMACAGYFPGGDYTDGRYDSKTVKDQLDANLGRMPILKIGEASIGQSVAINYYIAKATNLMGTTVLETSQILSIQEHLKEMKQAFHKLIPYGTPPTPELLEKWFTTGATDYSGMADQKSRYERYMKWFTGRLEGVVGSGGFAVGGKLSLADILIYNVFAETLLPEESSLKEGEEYKAEPFYSSKGSAAAIEDCPKIKGIISSVKSDPGVQKWLKIRASAGAYIF